MPAFELNATVHYGYLRAPGVYDDLSEADMRALGKYGRRIDIPSEAPEVTPSAPPSVTEEVPPQTVQVPSDATLDAPPPADASPISTEVPPAASATRPDEASPRPPDAGPFHCPADGCKFSVGRKHFPTAAARDAHRTQKNH